LTCHDCLQYKGRKTGHSSIRNEKFKTPAPLLLFSTDFFGKVEPTSFRGNKWGMLYICDDCGFGYAKPLARKNQAPEALEEFVHTIRKRCGVDVLTGRSDQEKTKLIVAGIHSDNEPVLKSQAWKGACDRLNIEELHSVPYSPAMNGTIERYVQSIKSALRTTAAFTDPRLWDFALEHVVKVWNMKKRKHNSGKHCLPPEEIVNKTSNNPLRQQRDVTAKGKYLRRYGCLSYFKPHQVKKDHEAGTALQPRRKRGMHLGFSDKNSAWLIGTYENGELKVYETRSVTFCEDILVRNIQELNQPEPSVVEQLLDRVGVEAGEGATVGVGTGPAAGEGARDWLQGLHEIQWEVPEDSNAADQLSGSPQSFVQPKDIAPKAKKEEAVATKDIDPGETSIYLHVETSLSSPRDIDLRGQRSWAALRHRSQRISILGRIQRWSSLEQSKLPIHIAGAEGGIPEDPVNIAI
jgi:hypothetical protein